MRLKSILNLTLKNKGVSTGLTLARVTRQQSPAKTPPQREKKAGHSYRISQLPWMMCTRR